MRAHVNPEYTYMYPNKHNKNCIAFVQQRPNVFDVGSTSYKCYTNVSSLLGKLLPLLPQVYGHKKGANYNKSKIRVIKGNLYCKMKLYFCSFYCFISFIDFKTSKIRN